MSIIEKALAKARHEATSFPAAPATGPATAPVAGSASAQTANHAAARITPGIPLQPAVQTIPAPAPGGGKTPVQTKPAPTVVTANVNANFTGEEYRLLKERLLSIIKRTPGMNLFMVTSPMRNEGKTQVSCNLAMSMAHEFDHTVLLIDADLRSPKCHRLLGIPRPTGLSDCLLGGMNFWDALIHTNIGKLSFLSAGTAQMNPSELFSSNLMRDLLHEIKHRYSDRIIIIDTSPILPFAETRALSHIVDGVILVARENITLKAHLESSLHSLDGSNILGIVYNDVGNYGTDKEIFNLCYTY